MRCDLDSQVCGEIEPDPLAGYPSGLATVSIVCALKYVGVNAGTPYDLWYPDIDMYPNIGYKWCKSMCSV